MVVDGEVVRTATGLNTEALRPHNWDVEEFQDREAHLEIVDEETGQVVVKNRNVQVYEVLEFARVRAPGTDEDRWLKQVEN